eukprot:CAMPEP_0114239714 /NCGR_PEP_ID=MMETSP0058-20121206/8626_1 /TAXON_ID=36894 /ORGANISM="Pyramimonas parkeae, CCMP726" /LENGTH=385 /DNA_ID=CAMNT_0001351951 /DNA_START=370 /DNA_END=1526 /DNA_ORIENTATION=-
MFIGDTPTSLEVLSRVCRNAADLQLGPPATSNTYVVSATKAHCSSGLGLLLGRGCAAVLVTLRGTNTALAPCVGIARAGPSRLLARDGGTGDSPALSGGLAGITGGRARAGGVFAGDSQGTAFKLLDVSACSLCGDSSLLLESHPPLSFALGGPYRGEWEMASGLVLGSRRLGGGETGAAAGVSFSFLRRGLAGESLDCGADLAGGGFVRGVTLQSKEMSVSSSTSGSSVRGVLRGLEGTAFKLLDVSVCSLHGNSSLLLESHPLFSSTPGGTRRGEWEMESGLVLGSSRLGGGETGAFFRSLRRGLARESLDCGASLAGGGFVRDVTSQSKGTSASSSISGSSGSANSCSSLTAPLDDGAGTTVSSFCTGLVLRWLDLVGPGTR